MNPQDVLFTALMMEARDCVKAAIEPELYQQEIIDKWVPIFEEARKAVPKAPPVEIIRYVWGRAMKLGEDVKATVILAAGFEWLRILQRPESPEDTEQKDGG